MGSTATATSGERWVLGTPLARMRAFEDSRSAVFSRAAFQGVDEEPIASTEEQVTAPSEVAK